MLEGADLSLQELLLIEVGADVETVHAGAGILKALKQGASGSLAQSLGSGVGKRSLVIGVERARRRVHTSGKHRERWRK